jgi:outer membrane murein-binding lipoprotein Lpp
MSTTLRRILALSVLVAPLAIAGCASQTEIDQLRSELITTQASADAAAAAEAHAAKAEAAEAKARADAASQAAGDVSRKADRMYDRSLRK